MKVSEEGVILFKLDNSDANVCVMSMGFANVMAAFVGFFCPKGI